jgi:hypothetical protein
MTCASLRVVDDCIACFPVSQVNSEMGVEYGFQVDDEVDKVSQEEFDKLEEKLSSQKPSE